MPEKRPRLRALPLAAPALFALLCRLSPRFAALALRRVTRPLLLALHRWTARVPFPVAESLAFALALLALETLAASGVRALRRRSPAPLARWLRGVGRAALAAFALLALTWLPALTQPVEQTPTPTVDQLEWLCGELIDALSDAQPTFPTPRESLRRAPEAAGLGGAVKAARYPEWMRAAAVSGVFVPVTGEALADDGAPAALAPFTAVHELMHLRGIADEGAANIAAWERCMEAGGPFADSARLWALRYAMGLLMRADGEAWQRTRSRMPDALLQLYLQSGGEALASASPSGLPRLSPARGDYAALVGWLVKAHASCSNRKDPSTPLRCTQNDIVSRLSMSS